MSVRTLLTVRARPGQADSLPRHLKDGLRVQAADEGCQAITLFRSIERPDECLIEFTWESQAAHFRWRDAHRDEWREQADFETQVQESEPLGHYSYVGTVKGNPPAKA